ncbi:MAG: MotE family protein [Methylovirgula sp.]
MRKVSFSLLVSITVGLAACLMVSQPSRAGDAGEQVANGVLNLHPHASAKRARAKRGRDRRIDATAIARKVPRRFAALVDPAPTQPDIAGPPPASQVPPGQSPASQSSGTPVDGKGAVAGKDDKAQRASAVEEKSAAAAAAAKRKARELASLPREVRQFCVNTANAAANARIAWQAARLTELTTKLRQRIAELEAKRAEYEDWLHKHDEALQEARKDIVAIYSRMRPDAAAAQLSVMDEVMAASLLTKLNSRVASAILAEMDPGRAARIANAMLGPPIPADGKKS